MNVTPLMDGTRFPVTGWDFAQELDLLLNRRGLSQRQAATLLDTSQGYISQLCHRERNPSRKTIKTIAGGLSLTQKEEARLMVLAGFVPDGLTAALLQHVEWTIFPAPEMQG